MMFPSKLPFTWEFPATFDDTPGAAPPPGPSRLKNGVPAPLRGGESGERRACGGEA